MKTFQIVIFWLFSGLILSAQNNLSEYEYWFNDDYASRLLVGISPSGQNQLSATLDASPLPEGVNVLNLRYRDENGLYSSTLSRVFVKNTSPVLSSNMLIGYEYWFNNDYSSRKEISISPVVQNQLSTVIDASSLPEGVNLLNIRYKDQAGIYSSTLSRVFVKNTSPALSINTVTGYEYWFNNDYDNKFEIGLTPEQQQQTSVTIDASALPVGVNILNIRYKDQSGVYSSTVSKIFCKQSASVISENKITAFRYWLDADFEHAVLSEIPASQETVMISDNMDMTRVPKGPHIIHVQAKDSLNIWSVVMTDTIEKSPLPVSSFTASVESTCDSATVVFTDNSIDGDVYSWDFGDGTTDTVPNPEHIYYTPGIYTVSLTVRDTTTLQDSTSQTIIEYTRNTYGSVTTSICESYLSPSGKYTYTVSGKYSDTLTGSMGCDSIIVLDITILKPAESTDIISACGSYTWIDGVTYTESNNTAQYTFTGGASNGCDSTVTLNLTIHPINISVVQNNATLTAGEIEGEYQWLDCNNNMTPLVGETQQHFTATVSGNYAIEISKNSCKDTSVCMSVTVLGVPDNNPATAIKVFPNPTQGDFSIILEEKYPEVWVTISDVHGSIIEQYTFKNEEKLDFELNHSSGIYFITLIANEKTAVLRIMKN